MNYRCMATVWLFSFLSLPPLCLAQETAPEPDTRRGDEMISSYFSRQTGELEKDCLANIHSLEDWEKQRLVERGRLLEMLGLHPLPERTALKPVITGQTEHDQFTV